MFPFSFGLQAAVILHLGWHILVRWLLAEELRHLLEFLFLAFQLFPQFDVFRLGGG